MLKDRRIHHFRIQRLHSSLVVSIRFLWEIDTLTSPFELQRIRRRPRVSSRAPCTLSARDRSENNHSPTAQIVAAVGWSLRGLFAYANRQSTAFLCSSLSLSHYSFQGEFIRFGLDEKGMSTQTLSSRRK